MFLKLVLAVVTAAILHNSLEDSNIIINSDSYKSLTTTRTLSDDDDYLDMMTGGQKSSSASNKSLHFEYVFLRPQPDQSSVKLHRLRRDEPGPAEPDGPDDYSDEDDKNENHGGDIKYSAGELIFTDPFDESPKGYLPWLKWYFELLKNSSLGCALYENDTQVIADNDTDFFNKTIKERGTAGEGEECGYINGSPNLTRCKLFEYDNCTKPTFLFCTFADYLTNRTTRICRKSMFVEDLQSLRIFKHVDNSTGCLLNYIKSRDIPVQLQGDRIFKEPCDPSSLDHTRRCKWYTQAPIYSDETLHIDKPSCLKPTHLYCDPLLLKCLCGEDQDPTQFQNEVNSHKCYIRPTYDYNDGYDCAPGSAPSIVAIGGGVKMRICKCQPPFYAPYFNSVDPNWWKCSASSSPPYALVLLFAAFFTVVCQFKITC